MRRHDTDGDFEQKVRELRALMDEMPYEDVVEVYRMVCTARGEQFIDNYLDALKKLNQRQNRE